MKPYTAQTSSGRAKAGDDIHHRALDGDRENCRTTAKAQRKAARRVDWTQMEIPFPRV